MTTLHPEGRKILLLGDSIMYGAKGIHGYGYYVQQNLLGKAATILPNDNCMDIRFLLSCADDLIPGSEDGYDLIHWNNGLWDVLHFAGNQQPHTDIDLYAKTLCKFYSYLKTRYPGARIFFATTTPVPEHLNKISSYRRNTEICAYNEAARHVLDGKVDAFDDLYSAALPLGDEYRAKDGLHYTEDGSCFLGQKVTAFLSNYL